MKISEVFKGLNIDTQLNDINISGITCDSRKVKKDGLFVCIRGTNADGHKYANMAYESGAAAILCEQSVGLPNEIIVENTRDIYPKACANFYGNPADKLHLIGVTGTNGKTTSTYIIKHILEENGCKTGLVGTIQNIAGDEIIEAHNTTPDACELQELFSKMVKAGCTHCVMEVSSHALDQGRMDGCHYDVSVFTNLTQDHLDYHKTMDNYLLAKKKLFEISDVAVINADDKYSEKLIEGLSCKIVKYSVKSDSADYYAENLKYRADGVQFDLTKQNKKSNTIMLHIPGQFSAYNAIGSAVAAIEAGIDFDKACAGLDTASGVKGRVEVVPTGRDFSVIIDYAHTPDGLVNVLSALKATVDGRLVALFGCGGDRDRTKRPLMAKAVMQGADFAIVTSDNPRTENPSAIIKDVLEGVKGFDTPYVVIENRREAIYWAIEHAQPNDVILLAGKGHETYQILNTGTIHFDEREVVRDALKEIFGE